MFLVCSCAMWFELVRRERRECVQEEIGQARGCLGCERPEVRINRLCFQTFQDFVIHWPYITRDSP